MDRRDSTNNQLPRHLYYFWTEIQNLVERVMAKYAIINLSPYKTNDQEYADQRSLIRYPSTHILTSHPHIHSPHFLMRIRLIQICADTSQTLCLHCVICPKSPACIAYPKQTSSLGTALLTVLQHKSMRDLLIPDIRNQLAKTANKTSWPLRIRQLMWLYGISGQCTCPPTISMCVGTRFMGYQAHGELIRGRIEF